MAAHDDFDRRLALARQGEPVAFRWIWDRYAGPIRGFLTSRATPEVDEAVNDVFAAAFKGLDGFAGGEPDFSAWLHGIARNKRVDQLRQRARRERLLSTATIPDQTCADNVEDQAIARVADDELRWLLEGLTPDQRDVIVLRFISALSLDQTATALAKPVGAVKAAQHRAIALLRKKLAAEPYPAGQAATI